jgi:lysozyme
VQAAYGLGVNKSFPKNFAMAKACGLYRGAYHFLTPRESGRVQAERFLAHVGDDLGDLPPAVDVEKPVECKTECCDKSCADFRLVVEEWLDTVERTSGRRAMVYTVEPYFNQCLCGTSKLRGTRPLWLAGYPKFDFPERVTLAWGTWDFYQYLGNARVKGTLVDLNLASRTPEALGAWLAEVRAR